MLPAHSAGHPGNKFYYFSIVPIHPPLQGGAFSAPAGKPVRHLPGPQDVLLVVLIYVIQRSKISLLLKQLYDLISIIRTTGTAFT